MSLGIFCTAEPLLDKSIGVVLTLACNSKTYNSEINLISKIKLNII